MKNFLHSLKSDLSRKHQRPLYMVALLLCLNWITASAQAPTFTRNECGCMNNETSWGNGQFTETITITSAPGLTWTIVAANGLYSAASPAPPAAPLTIPAGTVITEGPAGSYVLNARRVDNSNYSLIVTNGTTEYTVNSLRTCRYPRNEILGDIGACVDSDNKTYRIDVANSMLPSVAWTISGGGSTVGSLTTNTLVVNWGAVVGSYDVRVNGTARAYAGQTSGFCNISDTITVDIADELPIALACNNLIHLSMNGRCELSVTPEMVLETILFPTTASSYDVVLRDMEKDTIIPNTRISQKYIGKTIEAKVVQECSTNSCWGLIKLEDKSIPSLVCNPDVTIDCNQLTGPQVTGYPLRPDAIVTPLTGNKFLVKNFDYCSDVILEYYDQITKSDCVGDFSSVVTRTWVVTDISGNSSTCSSDIYIRKADSADIVFPSNWDDVLGPNPSIPACGNWPKLANGHPDPIYTGSPQGVFCLNVTVDFQDTKIPKCRGDKTFKLLRKWIVTDLCNATQIIRNQTITVMDKDAPVIVAPADFTVGTTGLTCASQIKLPHPTITDCSNTQYYVSYNVPDLTGAPSPGPGSTDGVIKNSDGTFTIQTLPAGVTTIWVTYLAVDDCDNASEDITRVDIKDGTPPVPVCDQFSFAGLNDDGLGYVTVESLDDGSWDNCGIDYLEARRMETSSCSITNEWGQKIKFCCEDAGKSFMVQLRVVDKAGNSNTCMVEVRVQDNVPPTLTNCPANITVDCNADLLSLGQYGKPTASDNCSVNQTEEVKDNGFDDCGRGSISRIFTATDNFGNKSTCVQVITVRPTNPFNANNITWPQDHTFPNGCLATGIAPENMPAGKQKPTWATRPCSQIAIEHEDIVFQYVEGFCFKVLRKWTVIDWCQFNPLIPSAGKWTYTQVIKGQNNTAPTITKGCLPADVKITQVDNCQALIEATATATDDCTQGDKFVWSYVLDVDNNGTKDFTGNTNTVSRTVSFGKHTITWTVTDECGNSKTCSNTFEVKDQKKPTPYCLSEITTVIMEQDGTVEIWASDFNAGSYDNCSPNPNLKFSFTSNVLDAARTFRCADMTDNTTRFELKIYVTDLAGNQDFCTTHINIQDNNNTCGFGNIDEGEGEGEESKKVSVSGAIRMESNESVENVALMLESQQPEFPKYIYSNEQGEYTFNDLITQNDYTITPSKNDDYLNGLSTLDLILIQRHILGVKKLESPYKIIACDANSDDKVTASDLVALRKLILGLTDKLANSDSWKFVDKSHVFADPTKPFPYQSSIGMGTLEHNVSNGDFVAVKVGDINASYQRNAQSNEAENRTRTSMMYAATALKAGESITVPFEVAEAKNIAGIQFSMVFDQDKFEFKGIEQGAANVTEDDIYVVDNTLLMSWANSKKYNEENGKLFGLTFVAKQDIAAGEWFNLNDRMLKSEVYFNEDENITASSMDLELRGKSNYANSTFELYQNTPNPFNHTTTIGFTIPEAGEVSFKVYDYNGTVLKQFRKNYDKGYNTIELNVSEFNKAGILFYQLDSKTHSANKKMIVIK
ncbi:MAG: T9SS type A sorting domain-containing protein [Saprospiraceae bacterium]|nr:T9SS type A sorting domain-containing protein [Saprospiraceae bacterium]